MYLLGDDSGCTSRTARTWCAAALAFVLAACAFTRLYDLGLKSIMHDETLFVYYTYAQLYKSWSYTYLPILHGPIGLMFQALCFHIFGESDAVMRLSCALCGVGGIFWVWAMRPWLGRAGTWTALAFYTLAPGIGYFQRFFHMDGYFVFITLWLVASLAHWWRSRAPGWLASAIIAWTALFTNKESSLFVYFSIVTFAVLWIMHDLARWLLSGRDRAGSEFIPEVPPIPSPIWGTAIIAGTVTLCLTQIFEGIKYDADVVGAIGHDWVLRDVRSIPLALGWTTLDPVASGAGDMASGAFWRKFYAALLAGSFALCWFLRAAAQSRIGAREALSGLWLRLHIARWHIAGAFAASIALYLFVFTTGFSNPIGFFDIYARTWAYWGGQHEWGRIAGPFHQHMASMLVYELPSVLIVFGAWIAGLFRGGWTRTTGIAFFLVAIAVGAFQSLLFSGVQVVPPGGSLPEALRAPWLKAIFFALLAAGSLSIVIPRFARALVPLALFGIVAWSAAYLATPQWNALLGTLVYRGGEAVRLSNRHVTFSDFMEIQFNFDGGSSLAIVLVLVFFAALYAWHELDRGARFHAFLVWWTVTSVGAASYAREAVPQVGVSAMLPCVLLAASYAQRWFAAARTPAARTLFFAAMGLFALWNAKAFINLNFRNPDDVRERMVYGHGPSWLKAHAQLVTDYAEAAPIRMRDPGTPEWLKSPNDLPKHKQVRIAVQSDHVIWHMRWYLRDLDWREIKDLSQPIEEGWEFLFADFSADRNYPQLAEKYHLFRSVAIRFDISRPLDPALLAGIWRELVQDHYRNQKVTASLQKSKAEWNKIWRYLLYRDYVDGGENGKSGTLTATDYIFAIRKDLF